MHSPATVEKGLSGSAVEQSSHALAPRDTVNEFAAHEWHSELFVSGECRPGGQRAHALAPSTEAYFPLSHTY